jgi:hypothetical protein
MAPAFLRPYGQPGGATGTIGYNKNAVRGRNVMRFGRV